jgi:hypothetical protein
MIGIAETAEQDERNDWGLPPVSADVPYNRGNVHQAVDNSVNKPMPWVVLVAIVACSMAGVALGLSIGAKDTANESKRIAERETRLQRLELDEMKVALQTQGIKVHEGSTP